MPAPTAVRTPLRRAPEPEHSHRGPALIALAITLLIASIGLGLGWRATRKQEAARAETMAREADERKVRDQAQATVEFDAASRVLLQGVDASLVPGEAELVEAQGH